MPSQHLYRAPSERKPEEEEEEGGVRWCWVTIGWIQREKKGRTQRRRWGRGDDGMERAMSGWVETSGEKKKKKSVQFFVWSFICFPGRAPPVGPRRGKGVSWWREGARGGQRSSLYLCVFCVRQPAISCCPGTALSLGAWRRSGVSCCPGTPAERRPAPTPESHRPPSPSDLKTHRRALQTADTWLRLRSEQIKLLPSGKAFESMQREVCSSTEQLWGLTWH